MMHSLRASVPSDPRASDQTAPVSNEDATVHPITTPPAAWLYEWANARERLRTAAADAARALAQSDRLDNELIATTHDGLMRTASLAFAREFGITVDLMPERRVVHLHQLQGPSSPLGDAS